MAIFFFKQILWVFGYRELNNGMETENLFCLAVIGGMTLNLKCQKHLL